MAEKSNTNVITAYLSLFKSHQFVIYAIIIGIANGALMIYVANAPFLILEKSGLSGDMFSLIFSINALGLMISSYLPSYLQRFLSKEKMIRISIAVMTVASLLFLFAVTIQLHIVIMLFFLFFFVFPIGLIFSTATDLAMGLFSDENSGSASSMFGAIQLGIAFLFSMLSGLMANGTMIMVGIIFLLCCLSGVFVLLLTKLSVRRNKVALQENKA